MAAQTRPVEAPVTPPGTRAKLVRSLLEAGPSTAAVLAQRLDITPAAVRKHLEAMLAYGLVEARPQRSYAHRGRGRPARTFALTDRGRQGFHQGYDDLATTALDYLAEIGGPQAVEGFARARVAELERRYGAVATGATPAERAALLAEALTGDGYAASAAVAPAAGGGAQVCQHHCPVAHVAERYPQLCEAETEVFARLLGTHVQRLATIAHGDGVCTTYVPAAVSATSTPPSSTTAPPSSGRTAP